MRFNNQCLQISRRNFSSSIKPKVLLNDEVNSNIDNALFKPRNHPGRIKIKPVVLPDKLIKAVDHVVQDHPVKSLLDTSEAFARYLHFRVPPLEQRELKDIKRQVLKDVLAKEKKTIQPLDEERFKQSVQDKVKLGVRERVYNWNPITYNVYNSLLYLFARCAPDYAVLVRVFAEINLRDSLFKPRSFFDFGSGTGTATWAANLYWKNDFFEYYNVDSSGDMNDLAQTLLHGGVQSKNSKGTFYRQFLPATNISYDLVVCAYSLLELPSARSRLQTILNLWNKTAQYLVVVEHGTNGGFKVVNEIRDFILGIEDEANKGHVFSPCPHDTVCPRFITDSKPCNFEVFYHPFLKASSIKKETFCYVVLKKGTRNADDLQWPRLVETPLVRSKHTICRMCTAAGKLEEVIFTARKHGKSTYYCARSSDWGDRLPIQIEPNCVSSDEQENL